MYRMVVAARVRRIFARLSAGDGDAMTDSLAPRFVYRFYGDHALAGERRTASAISRWWDRVFRLFPGARFEPQDVLVTGWPWSTRVACRVVVRTTLPDGARYENPMHQFMRLRWGRVTEILTLEDTQNLQRALAAVAASGVTEAQAPPIVDDEERARIDG